MLINCSAQGLENNRHSSLIIVVVIKDLDWGNGSNMKVRVHLPRTHKNAKRVCYFHECSVCRGRAGMLAHLQSSIWKAGTAA